ncbi:hypothetical protein ACA910_011134 [Epithemia clementina (nom. ined.)]
MWLIWTDLNLDKEIKDNLCQLIAKIPHAVVVGAEQSTTANFRSLNGIADTTHSTYGLDEVFIADNKELFIDYDHASRTRLLVETLLDADDALSKSFAETTQAHAARTIGQSNVNQFKMEIFCPEHHVEWQYFTPVTADRGRDSGRLTHFHNEDFCINSGLSIAYHLHATSRQLVDTNRFNSPDKVPHCRSNYSESDQDNNGPTGRFLRDRANAEALKLNRYSAHNLLQKQQEEAQQLLSHDASEREIKQLALKQREEAEQLAIEMKTETKEMTRSLMMTDEEEGNRKHYSPRDFQ